MANRKRTKITLSREDLEASLDSFLVESPEIVTRGHVIAAADTQAGFTCNFKCGPTAYWECGPTSIEATC